MKFDPTPFPPANSNTKSLNLASSRVESIRYTTSPRFSHNSRPSEPGVIKTMDGQRAASGTLRSNEGGLVHRVWAGGWNGPGGGLRKDSPDSNGGSCSATEFAETGHVFSG